MLKLVMGFDVCVEDGFVEDDAVVLYAEILNPVNVDLNRPFPC